MLVTRRWRPVVLSVLAAAAVASCGESGDTVGGTTSTRGVADMTTSTAAADVATTTGPSSATVDAIVFDAIPPIRAGMTLRDAQAAYGRSITVRRDLGYEGDCFFAVPEGLEGRVVLLLLAPDQGSPVTDPLDAVIGRASV